MCGIAGMIHRDTSVRHRHRDVTDVAVDKASRTGLLRVMSLSGPGSKDDEW